MKRTLNATINRLKSEKNNEHYTQFSDIGNAVRSLRTCPQNNLNQLTSSRQVSASSAPPREPTYDADGNILSDGTLSFTYDSANRLKVVFTNGVVFVTNFYDAKSRRVRKVTSEATTTFFYDDWNLIEERVAYTNGTSSTIRYFWGKDLSGTLQGAGGVAGLLYLTVSNSSTPNSSTQQLYIPCYDNNGNVTRYLDASGNTVALYTYDAFGNIISKSSPLADFFRHRFSTKYYDAETGLYYYGYRFYHPILMRWLNRDQIEEEGGSNLYAFCNNSGVFTVDVDGRWSLRWPWSPDWTEDTARQSVTEEIQGMRRSGYNFAADALAHFLSNTGRNIDLSQYANEISSNIHWQRSFFDSILAKLQEQDPAGTGRKFTIGDIGHAANFDKPMLETGNIGNLFTVQFYHRFHQTQSMGLFYALYGSRYSYYGTASWKRCNNSNLLVYMTTTKINVDVKVVSWDMLTYPKGMGRTAINSYSAANYLEQEHKYEKPYIFLRWDEKGKWTSTFWSTINGGGENLKKEE